MEAGWTMLGAYRFVRVFCGLLMAVVLFLTACAPTRERLILKNLQAQLASQYHNCVPLGWSPVPVAGTYYPGHSIESSQEASWLKALWVGFIQVDGLNDPEVRATRDVLEHLVRAGLVAENRFPHGYRYHLTMAGAPYYFDGNDFHNNPDHIPYLCYSKIAPEGVVWTRPVHSERVGDRTADIFRVSFQWKAGENASWASDPLLRSHSVTLAPVTSPAIATFIRSRDVWVVAGISTFGRSVPRVADASVWPR